jgi:hypothetical protein
MNIFRFQRPTEGGDAKKTLPAFREKIKSAFEKFKQGKFKGKN